MIGWRGEFRMNDLKDNKDIQVMSKKNWLKDRIDEGFVFLKANVRGKCFIEYIPAEYAWAPVEAEDYMYIDCLWVSGQLKGHGCSNLLLDACMEDSREKGKKGLVILSSKKKMGFLSDPVYMAYKGFQSVHIRTREDAQNAPSAFTTFSLFHDGQLVTHEILSEKKFDKILADKGL
ncbi:MAG: hypothetical protein HFH98_07245 [Lachnospiraceae bacterium]|jgi:N-acetylglutamate synthase-like GNAT family acetyltransferase|nr:hypothetical protein [Lachnospiraceae bacterium]